MKRCLNLGSYNYLGFAGGDEYCTPRVLDTMAKFGWAMCSSRVDAGVCPPGLECSASRPWSPGLATACPRPPVHRGLGT